MTYHEIIEYVTIINGKTTLPQAILGRLTLEQEILLLPDVVGLPHICDFTLSPTSASCCFTGFCHKMGTA